MADLKYYDIIQKPIITEKSMTAMSHLQNKWKHWVYIPFALRIWQEF